MSTDRTLTVERLREVLDYDPDTGVFRWKKPRTGSVKVGDRAGTIKLTMSGHGYRHIMIDQRSFLAHRLAWFYVYGVWPTSLIDHRNGNPDDNRIANLREATHTQNQQNRHRGGTGPSGLLGVRWRKNRSHWVASIHVEGRNRYLGSFATPEAAHAAYMTAKRELHPFWEDTARQASG